MSTNLREQIEAAAIGHYPNDWTLLRIVLDIIDAHRCIDRDRLAQALPNVMSQEVCDSIYEPGTDPLDCPEWWVMTPYEMADAIIAALKEKQDD